MKVHGFIEKVETMKEGKFEIIRITLAPGYESLMLKRKSKPGLRKYLSKEQLRPIKHNYGIGVVSTSQGLMTTVEAKDKGLGGEYICEIY
jgi:small subunit ribosomal protein S8